MRDKYHQLKDAGRLTGTLAQCRRKAIDRAALCAYTPPRIHERMYARRVAIPLGIAGDPFEIQARLTFPGRKNWDTSRPVPYRFACGWKVHTRDHGQYSRRCHYHRLSYTVELTSYGYLCADGSLAFRFAAKPETRITPPKGYHWDKDANGIKLASNRHPAEDYHPTAEDLLTLSPRQLAGRVRENAATRRRAQRETAHQKALVLRAEKEGLMVCAADSISAGNCRAGTETWAKRHGLIPSKHYRPSKILAVANGDTHLAALVVAVALRRHRLEMDRGFALLSDHQI
jgi:hypothetical protein